MAQYTKKMMYDDEEDILFLSKGQRVKSSIDVGDFIIDLDAKGFISGIEILNASENLKLPKEQLKSLKEASLSVTYNPSCVYIYLIMKFKDKEKDITIPLTVDLGHCSATTEKTEFAVA